LPAAGPVDPADRGPALRIVTLLPAATEIVCALGLRDRLVGRSHECDFPPGVEALPALTRSRVESGASSGAIDRQVRAVLDGGGPLYDVDQERLAALAPDVVVTQEACEVCAVSYQQVAACVESAALDAAIVSLGPQRLDDVLADVGRVAHACGVAEEGARLEDHLRRRLRSLRQRPLLGAGESGRVTVGGPEPGAALQRDDAAGRWLGDSHHAAVRQKSAAVRQIDAAVRHDPAASRHDGEAGLRVDERGSWPRVAVVEWLDPPMLAGHWVPDVVEAAGGVPLGPPAGAPSPYVSWEEIAALAPDVVVVAPCGFDLARVEAEASPHASRLRALAPRVLLVDGNAYLNRPGPRLVDAAEILARFLRQAVVASDRERRRRRPEGTA
jgi:iron complex transport system substrate-binding protein